MAGSTLRNRPPNFLILYFFYLICIFYFTPPNAVATSLMSGTTGMS